MKISWKRIILLFLMLSIVSAISVFAGKMNIKEVAINFPDGYILNLTSNGNESVDSILSANNIILLENEVVNSNITDKKINITISRKDSNKTTVNSNYVDTNTFDISKNYKNLVEKIETERVEIPFNTITKNAENAEETRNTVIQAGKNGVKEVKYRALYSDDKLIDKKEISSKVIEEPVDRIVQVMPKLTSRSASAVRYANSWGYTPEELDLLCALTAQECSSSYEGALAVITCASNRSESAKWRRYGTDPLSQYKAQGQFTYSIDGKYVSRLNGNYPGYVKQAVIDALNGKRNHNYLSFRSGWTNIQGTNIGGNIYFNPM